MTGSSIGQLFKVTTWGESPGDALGCVIEGVPPNLKIDETLINRIYKYASVKHILDKNFDNDQKIIEIFNEIIRDLKNYELELRIADLESKFSKDLSETTFNELKELKKQQKTN